MAAFNVVRFRVKPGNEQAFIEAHRKMGPAFKGCLGGSLLRTVDRTFGVVGEWRNFQSIVNARPHMVSMLDEFRGMLEDLGNGLGVTDPVSGESVARLGPSKPAAKKRTAAGRRAVKRAAGKMTGGKRKAGKAKSAARKRKR